MEYQLMDQRIPEPIQPLLQNYLLQVNQQTPNLVTAFYIEGSIALDGFNEHFSDIDFIAILNRQITSTEIATLRNIHQSIEKSFPKWRMSGSYLQVSDLSYFTHDLGQSPSYHDGVLQPHGTFELNSVEGWILKNHGIALIGPESQTLGFNVDWNLLIQKMRGNLNSYWKGWTNQPQRLLMLFSDWGIQWAVLGVLRQFYSFRENSITTKTKAGEYALTCTPEKWHRLIQEALDIRAGRKHSAYHFRLSRTIEAIEFLKFVIQTCNDFPSPPTSPHSETDREPESPHQFYSSATPLDPRVQPRDSIPLH